MLKFRQLQNAIFGVINFQKYQRKNLTDFCPSLPNKYLGFGYFFHRIYVQAIFLIFSKVSARVKSLPENRRIKCRYVHVSSNCCLNLQAIIFKKNLKLLSSNHFYAMQLDSFQRIEDLTLVSLKIDLLWKRDPWLWLPNH